MDLSPLSQEEYDRWEPWPSAYNRLRDLMGYDEARSEICRRLILGNLRCCYRQSDWQKFQPRESIQRYREVLPAKTWRDVGTPSATASVWKTGSFDFVSGGGRDRIEIQCQGLRLEPLGISQILADAGLEVSTPENVQQQTPQSPVTLKPLSAAEYKNLSRALVAGWDATLTEDNAWAMAKRMFPDHSVKRREFLVEFRRERTPKKPGKQPSRQ